MSEKTKALGSFILRFREEDCDPYESPHGGKEERISRYLDLFTLDGRKAVSLNYTRDPGYQDSERNRLALNGKLIASWEWSESGRYSEDIQEGDIFWEGGLRIETKKDRTLIFISGGERYVTDFSLQ